MPFRFYVKSIHWVQPNGLQENKENIFAGRFTLTWKNFVKSTYTVWKHWFHRIFGSEVVIEKFHIVWTTCISTSVSEAQGRCYFCPKTVSTYLFRFPRHRCFVQNCLEPFKQAGGQRAQCVELLLEGVGKSKKRIFMGFLFIFG